ncbi:MAG: RNA polymerase sigma factor [Thermoflexaceae bacterium]|nr:RNA polymerase sigma factor [Thermoflexaceae bacterium]
MTGNRDCEMLSAYIVENQEKFYRLAYSYMQNEVDALDMVSEAIVSAYECFGKLRNRDGLKTWFYRILVNKCIDALRRNKREIVSEEDTFSQITFEEKSYDATGSVLQCSVEQLPEKFRTVIVLKYYENCTFEEIAKITKVNVNTVKSRLYAGLEKLRGLPEMKGVEN